MYGPCGLLSDHDLGDLAALPADVDACGGRGRVHAESAHVEEFDGSVAVVKSDVGARRSAGDHAHIVVGVVAGVVAHLDKGVHVSAAVLVGLALLEGGEVAALVGVDLVLYGGREEDVVPVAVVLVLLVGVAAEVDGHLGRVHVVPYPEVAAKLDVAHQELVGVGGGVVDEGVPFGGLPVVELAGEVEGAGLVEVHLVGALAQRHLDPGVYEVVGLGVRVAVPVLAVGQGAVEIEVAGVLLAAGGSGAVLELVVLGVAHVAAMDGPVVLLVPGVVGRLDVLCVGRVVEHAVSPGVPHAYVLERVDAGELGIDELASGLELVHARQAIVGDAERGDALVGGQVEVVYAVVAQVEISHHPERRYVEGGQLVVAEVEVL